MPASAPPPPPRNRRSIALAATLCLALALTSGCSVVADIRSGLSNASTGPTPPDVSIPKPASAADLITKLPADIKADGALNVAVSANTAPLTLLGGDGETPTGAEVELVEAISAKLGLTTNWTVVDSDKVLSTVKSDQDELAVAGLFIDAGTKADADFVKTMQVGLGYVVAKGNPKGFDPASPCGFVIAVSDNAKLRSTLSDLDQACPADNKIDIKPVVQSDQAIAAVQSQRVDAAFETEPSVSWNVVQSEGALEAVGTVADVTDVGIAVPKQQADLAPLVAQALTDLKADGTYQRILDKWGLSDATASEFTVNP